MNDQKEIGDILGTDTLVQLPKEGVALDTASFGRNSNQHGNNNWLTVGGSVGPVVTPIQPGVVSKHHIDYSPPCTNKFEAAAMGSKAPKMPTCAQICK